ncbi:MAG TPA: ComF family protein [Nitrospiraceae bacterium]|nr:ComF family protein [Nitrospiraceae bacterium]
MDSALQTTEPAGLLSAWTSLLRRALHAVLPVECAECGTALADDPVPFFCRTCWTAIKPLAGPACPSCGLPFASEVALTYSPDHRCLSCRLHPPTFTKAWACHTYEPPLQNAIHLFKYRGKVALASALGTLMRHAWRQPMDADILMPVPLHPSRLHEREYNQSLLLADELNRDLRLPLVYDNLVRLRATPPQTELNRSERLANLRRCFSVRQPADVDGKRVLLIDDVMTTGTTANECAKVLRKAGANAVYVLTLARTV